MLYLEIQLYSNIRIILTQIFIRTFIRIRFFETNKFGYSFVQKHLYEYIRIFVRGKKNYANIFGYSFESKIWNEYIRIFVRVQILTNVTLCSKLYFCKVYPVYASSICCILIFWMVFQFYYSNFGLITNCSHTLAHFDQLVHSDRPPSLLASLGFWEFEEHPSLPNRH